MDTGTYFTMLAHARVRQNSRGEERGRGGEGEGEGEGGLPVTVQRS